MYNSNASPDNESGHALAPISVCMKNSKMNKFINRYSLIFLTAAVAAFYLGNNYIDNETPETTEPIDASESEDIAEQAYTLPETIAKKAGPHGAYDPHATLTLEKHIQVALQHKQEGRLNEAMRTLTMAILQHGDNKELYAVRGSIYLEQGQATEALGDIEKALKIDPDDSELLTNRAQVYRQFGQIQQALADLNRAIELNPELVAARFNRGAIYYSSEEFEQALHDFDQCIATDPHTAAPYFNRASANHALGDVAAARADLERFIQLSENEQWKATARELLQRWDATENEQNTAAPGT